MRKKLTDGARWVLAATIAAVSVSVCLLIAPAATSTVSASEAKPTPLISLFLTPKPSPSPTSSPTPSPSPGRDDEDEATKGESHQRERGANERDREASPREAGDSTDITAGRKRDRLNGRRTRRPQPNFTYRPGGSFDTDRLVAIEARLLALGWDKRKAMRAVYPPFVIAGDAAWADTWGAPRFGPGPKQVRQHEGQDVFCDAGAQVLAIDDGTVEFDQTLLGGRVARLYVADGSYWYYAHLSDWNDELSSGDEVKTGDVLGYCGTSGNAQGTPPHVHLGWYQPDGSAENPIDMLEVSLRKAEASSGAILERATRGARATIDSRSMRRRFGDALAPGRPSVLTDAEIQRALALEAVGFIYIAGPPVAEHGSTASSHYSRAAASHS